MTRDDLVPHIQRSWIYTKALKIDELFTGPTALDASDGFKALAMNSDVSYEELYLAGLREGQYNILLKDFAFFSLVQAVATVFVSRTTLIRFWVLRLKQFQN